MDIYNSQSDFRQDYDTSCESLTDEFCELEKHVNIALLNLVVEVFKETSEPLERLVRASMTELEVNKMLLWQLSAHVHSRRTIVLLPWVISLFPFLV